VAVPWGAPGEVRGAATAAAGEGAAVGPVSVHQPLYAVLQRHKEERTAFLDQPRPPARSAAEPQKNHWSTRNPGDWFARAAGLLHG